MKTPKYLFLILLAMLLTGCPEKEEEGTGPDLIKAAEPLLRLKIPSFKIPDTDSVKLKEEKK